MILRRISGSRYSEVLAEWKGRTAVLVGGGPSLSLDQVELVREAHAAGRIKVICINDSYLWAPWSDVLYAADASWHVAHTNGVAKPMLKLSAEQVRQRFAAFAGPKCSIQSQAENIPDTQTHILRNANVDGNGRPIHGLGLSLDPGALVTGRNGGYQALNLAILAGAKTIILLGYDGQPARDGRTHWSGGHSTPTPQEAYAAYREAFSAGEKAIKAAGVRVINASPDSAIGFEKMPLSEALDAYANLA